VRSRSLHAALSAFARETAACLGAERAEGAELPYDVVEAGRPVRGGTPLYCYRPMTGEFILARLDRLSALESYLPALRALASIDGLARYLRSLGRRGIPPDRRSCAELTLLAFLSEVFEDATEFELPKDRLERVYGRLEAAVFAEVTHTTLVGVLRGVEMESDELLLGAGLALIRPEAIDDGPPDELLSVSGEEPVVLATLSVEAAPGDPGTVAEGRHVLRGLVEALQLFGEACVALDPVGWMRVDDGSWHATVIGREAPTRGVLTIAELQEDEVRAFCSLVSRRAPRGGELAWALSRFRMGCERDTRWETLTDHLLALRALLEPEGPHTARLPGRLAALCALPGERPALAHRMADVLALERTVMEGLEPHDPLAERLADEVTRHLRALLRDVICGHLDSDVPALADGIIVQDAVPAAVEDGAESELMEEDGIATEPPIDDSSQDLTIDDPSEDLTVDEVSEDATVDEVSEDAMVDEGEEEYPDYDGDEQLAQYLDEVAEGTVIDEAPDEIPVDDGPPEPADHEVEPDPAAGSDRAEPPPSRTGRTRKPARPRAAASRSKART